MKCGKEPRSFDIIYLLFLTLIVTTTNTQFNSGWKTIPANIDGKTGFGRTLHYFIMLCEQKQTQNPKKCSLP